MKKTIVIVISIFLVVSGAIAVISYSRKGGGEDGEVKGGVQKISHYTCPMHPFIHEKKPGECPICHMKLVPVYTSPPTPLLNKERGAEGGVRSVTIPTERQQLIGLKTGRVEKKAVSKEVRIAGRVAFDPELAIAQREFLEIVKGVPSLKAAAVSRLRLLGMSPEEIRDLEKRKPSTDLYLPQAGESLWVYGQVYEHEIPYIKVGDKAEVVSLNERFEGFVRSIDPVLDPMTRTAKVRVEIAGAGGKIRPESFLNLLIRVDLGGQLTVPKTSVIDTGTRTIVFLVHDGSHFQAREVKAGLEAGEDRVILEGLSEGETVATSALFLIDSESQLKAAISGMEGHQH